MEFVRKWKWAIAAAAVIVVALVVVGVWQFWPTPQAEAPVAEEPTEEVVEAPPVVYGPEPPVQWAWTDMPWRLTRFDVPAGHWVYFSRWNREMLVIPGKPLPLGAEPPDEDALYEQAVVVFNDVFFDRDDFETWEGFVRTMAEFGCARGTGEEDYVLCGSEAIQETHGTSPVGPTYSFRLPKRQYATQASLGFAPFQMVRLGFQEGPYGILFYAIDPVRGEPLMRQMVQSLERTAEVDE